MDEMPGNEEAGRSPEGGSREPGAGPGREPSAGGERRNDRERHGREQHGWGAGGAFSELQDAVTDIVEGAMRSFTPLGTPRFPRYDLVQVPGEGYRVLMDLPGVNRDDLEVTTVEGELSVSGVRHRPELPEGADVVRSERSYGRFRRLLRLPADVDATGVRAKLEEGQLVVTLPRRPEAARQRVEVES